MASTAHRICTEASGISSSLYSVEELINRPKHPLGPGRNAMGMLMMHVYPDIARVSHELEAHQAYASVQAVLVARHRHTLPALMLGPVLTLDAPPGLQTDTRGLCDQLILEGLQKV